MLMDQGPKKLGLENYSYTAFLQIVNALFLKNKIKLQIKYKQMGK